jgi:hypothetical protein
MICYIKENKLYFLKNGKETEFQSPFLQEKLEQRERTLEHQGWKSKQTYPLTRMSWGPSAGRLSHVSYAFRHLIKASDDVIYYTLAFNNMTGLFRYSFSDGFEQRLFHKNDVYIGGIDHLGERNDFVVALASDFGLSNLFLMSENGRVGDQLTSGDSYDRTPRFISRDELIYSSGGIARFTDGNIQEIEPMRIHKLNFVTGEMETLFEDAKHDYLSPALDSKGNLYAIRRPYKSIAQKRRENSLKEFFLYPVHLTNAVFGFLESFIRTFNRTNLRTSGPVLKDKRKFIEVLGEFLDYSSVNIQTDQASLVPKSWQLVKIDANKEVTVLKERVCGYSLVDDILVYSNGFKVSKLKESSEEVLVKSRLIQAFQILNT